MKKSKYERKRLKKEVASRKGSQTVEGSLSGVFNTPTYKTFSKAFTTEPKLRRLVLHRQQTVRNRVYALFESFYPTKDVSYAAVKQRMATLLGIVDRASHLAYLGRPAYRAKSVMDQTVKYPKATVQKTHTFYRRLAARKGYIETFNVGYVYLKGSFGIGEWRIHWNHTEQLTLHPRKQSSPQSPLKLSSLDEGLEQNITSQKVSIDDFSLSINKSKGNTDSTRKDECEHGSRESEKRERYSIGERNCETESIHGFHGKGHSEKVKVNKNFATPLRNLTPLEKAILRISKEGDSK